MNQTITRSDRMSWDQYALSLAWVASLRSEDPFRKVGACALDYSNRVLGVAYNGVKPGSIIPDNIWSDRDKRRPFMIHAEANLLSLFKRDECKTIALTCSPCSACATLIIANNVQRVIYIGDYDKDLYGKNILNFYNIECIQYSFNDIISNITKYLNEFQ